MGFAEVEPVLVAGSSPGMGAAGGLVTGATFTIGGGRPAAGA
jgi:hypothetical protein